MVSKPLWLPVFVNFSRSFRREIGFLVLSPLDHSFFQNSVIAMMRSSCIVFFFFTLEVVMSSFRFTLESEGPTYRVWFPEIKGLIPTQSLPVHPPTLKVEWVLIVTRGRGMTILLQSPPDYLLVLKLGEGHYFSSGGRSPQLPLTQK